MMSDPELVAPDKATLYRLLVEWSRDVVWVMDLSRRFVFVSPSVERELGWTSAEFLSLRPEDWLAPDSLARVRRSLDDVFARLAAGEGAGTLRTRDLDLVHRRRDGALVRTETTLEVLWDESGKARAIHGITRSVEEQRRTEAELLKTSKLEAVSLLAGGIAHDFNNILASVMGNLSLARLGLGDLPGEAAEGTGRLLQEAEKAVLRARELTRRLITVSSGGASARETLDLAAFVREIGTSVAAASLSRFALSDQEGLPRVSADRVQLGQILQNLVLNAIQAMPRGGLVKASLSREDLPEDFNLAEGDWLRLDVDDEGPGVPDNLKGRIFDPYFTTKPQGSGIGLAVSLAVARAHGGDLAVSDAPSGGARFTLWLPAAPS